MRLAPILSLLLGSVALPVCHSQSPFQVGVGVHGENPQSATQDALGQLRATFREDALWSGLETTQGQLTYPDTGRAVDDWIASTVAANRRPLLILDYGNRFYDDGDLISSPEGIRAFARYAEFVVQHFQASVDQYEVWNEWNIGSGSPRKPPPQGDPIQYMRMLQATYKQLKASHPKVSVLGGVIGVGIHEMSWIERFSQAGGLTYLDGFSLHPYVQCNVGTVPGPPLNLTVRSETGTANAVAANPGVTAGRTPQPPLILGTPEEAINWIDKVQQLLDKYSPGRPLPLYITEIGWPTSTKNCGVSQQVAASYLQRFFLLAKSRPRIAGVWWYDLYDDADSVGGQNERFGLLTADGRPKPAFTALANIIDLVETSSPLSLALGSSGEFTVTGRTARGASFVAAWLPTSDFTYSLEWLDGEKLLISGYHVLNGSAPGGHLSVSATPTILSR